MLLDAMLFAKAKQSKCTHDYVIGQRIVTTETQSNTSSLPVVHFKSDIFIGNHDIYKMNQNKINTRLSQSLLGELS